MARSPDYVLTAPHDMNVWGEIVTLPSQAFVRPIELAYVPKHVKEDSRYQFFNADREVFCYTRYGFTVIAKHKMRQV